MARRKSETYFEEIGGRFDEWASPYDAAQRLAMIRRLLPQQAIGMDCLEVGCGRGAISAGIVRLVRRLTVADVSARLAREVGERLHIPWREFDACSIPLLDASFDLVISSECIEHTPDPRRALVQMARLVKPGGTLIVTSPNKLWFPVLWISMKTGVRKFAGNERWLFPFEAAGVLRRSGMSIAAMTGCHLWPWQLPLIRRLLPRFDRFGPVLYPLMINYGVAVTRRG